MMAILTKEVIADIVLLGGVSLPRCLTIPVLTMSSSPEMTDLLNIQMVVMTMLDEDTEMAKVVSSYWNLGVEIKAFNVQRQVWDLLDLEDNLEIPHRASIQVNITNNEPGDDLVLSHHARPDQGLSKRDPRRKGGSKVDTQVVVPLVQEEEETQLTNTSKRDPRRKQSSDHSSEVELPIITEPVKSIIVTEPNIQNLSKNDPRRKKLEKSQGVEVSTSLPAASAPVTKKRSKSSHSHEDSDSDEDMS